MSKVRFRLATINALGHSHTRPGGNKAKRGWLQAPRRTALLIAVITARRFSIVGLQEFQTVQQRVFRARTSLWGCHDYKDNAVIWLRPWWKLIDKGDIRVPYFHGRMRQMPWVVVERRSPRKARRKRIAFLSTHNPASVHGNAEKWRKEGWERESEWATGILERHPEIVAAIVVGDKNDTAKDYLPFVKPTGGKVSHVPQIWGIDWIAGWGAIEFEDGKTVETRRIKKMSDHPVTQAVGVI